MQYLALSAAAFPRQMRHGNHADVHEARTGVRTVVVATADGPAAAALTDVPEGCADGIMLLAFRHDAEISEPA